MQIVRRHLCKWKNFLKLPPSLILSLTGSTVLLNECCKIVHITLKHSKVNKYET